MASNIGSAVYAIQGLKNLAEAPQRKREERLKWTFSKLIELERTTPDLPRKQAIYDTMTSLYASSPDPLKQALAPLIANSPISDTRRKMKMYQEIYPADQYKITANADEDPELYGKQSLAWQDYQRKMQLFAGLPAPSESIMRFTSGGQEMISTYTSEGVPYTRPYDVARMTALAEQYKMSYEELEANGGNITTEKTIQVGSIGGEPRQYYKISGGFNVHTKRRFTKREPLGVMAPLAGDIPGYDPKKGRPRSVPTEMQKDFDALYLKDDKNGFVAVSLDKLANWKSTFKGLGKKEGADRVKAEFRAYLKSRYRRADAPWDFIIRDKQHDPGLGVVGFFTKWSVGDLEIIPVPGELKMLPVGNNTNVYYFLDLDSKYNQVYDPVTGMPLGSYQSFLRNLQTKIDAGEFKNIPPGTTVPQGGAGQRPAGVRPKPVGIKKPQLLSPETNRVLSTPGYKLMGDIFGTAKKKSAKELFETPLIDIVTEGLRSEEEK